ncbi:hypothetical protein M3Y98_00810700 [Aphelenchoides besseyi]|nr:hypothetical protein M3Y98_00810700 [Aphelenchoides besseyi]KAI6212130.1 hypothetical protein M3Y96_00507800 [Aphelenchoides besseyi]
MAKSSGHEVALRLRYLESRSPSDYQNKLAKLHKLLYGLKKRNPFFGGFGRLVRKLRRAF